MAEKKYGVMICGHGSRSKDAVAEFANLAERMKSKFSEWPVDYGYLEFATPVINDGLDRLRDLGCTNILAVPGMLFAAGHAKNDIPSVLNTYQASNPGVTVEYGRELGIDPKMIAAAGARIQEALDSCEPGIERHETLLMVVGRGASDPDANSNISKVMRMLWEGFGFGWGEVCYSGVTFPLVKPGLQHAAKLGYKRIIVMPYFLFSGILIDRIYDHTDIIAAEHPEIDFVKAGYLNDQDYVIDTFAERVFEIIEGTNNMNCQMCKYRTQVLGFETEVGLAQESHHHHVEGIGTGLASDHDHSHDHSHSHGHDHSHDPSHSHSHDHDHDDDDHDDDDHGHHHHPYPHADHPLGPKTMEGDLCETCPMKKHGKFIDGDVCDKCPLRKHV